MAAEFWNERYAQATYAYGEEPNVFFAEQLLQLPPGRLLLPAEGEGRNAVFAARHGWEVTAFDMSPAAQQKCRQLAAKHQVEVQFEVANAADFVYGEQQYDVVAMVFAHFPPELRSRVHQQAAASLKPGGLLLLEAFTPAQLHYESGGPKEIAMLYTAAAMRQDVYALQVQYCEEVITTLHEGPYHEGTAAVVRLIAQKR